MMPDLFAIHHRQLAKRTAQTRAEYACAIERHQEPAGRAEWVVLAVVVLLLIGLTH